MLHVWEETITNEKLRTIKCVTMPVDHDEDVFVTFDPPLAIQRYQFAYEILLKDESRIVRMADFGCAEGRFFRRLKKLPFVEEVNMIDILKTEVDEAAFQSTPLPWDIIFGRYVEMKLNLYQGSVVEPDDRLIGLDAITMIELIEHLDGETLSKIPSNIFGYYQPRLVIISTPNVEYNVHFPQLEEGKFRHWDHQFEWSREQFQSWCCSITEEYNYNVTYSGVGTPLKGKEDVGFCSQFAIFRRKSPLIISVPSGKENYDLLHSFTFPKRSEALTKNDAKVETLDWTSILKEDKSDIDPDIKSE